LKEYRYESGQETILKLLQLLCSKLTTSRDKIGIPSTPNPASSSFSVTCREKTGRIRVQQSGGIGIENQSGYRGLPEAPIDSSFLKVAKESGRRYQEQKKLPRINFRSTSSVLGYLFSRSKVRRLNGNPVHLAFSPQPNIKGLTLFVAEYDLNLGPGDARFHGSRFSV
jgi:hypothetical protein